MNGLGLPVCWAVCRGPNRNYQYDGQSIETLGAIDDPDNFIAAHYDRNALPERDEGEAMADRIDGNADMAAVGVTALGPETERCLLRILRTIAGLHRNELLLVHGLLNGLSLKRASEACGFTKQNGSVCMKRMKRRYPELIPFVESCLQPGGVKRK